MMRGVAAVLALVTGLALGTVLVGCSRDEGPPPDDSGALPAPSSGVADDPIPPVRDPKNLIAIQPCLMLTPAQLETTRIDQPGQPKAVLGSTGCEWGNTAKTRQFAVFVDIGNDVLGNVYNQRNAIPVFEVTEVAGLPAIRTMDDVDGSTCYVRVAAADTQTLIVRFTSLLPDQDREDPCDSAKAFAEMIVGNLPPLTG